MIHQVINTMEFEKEWVELSNNICQAIYNDENVKKIRQNLEKNGFLTLEEKSSFIDISDMIKYKLIYEKYGNENSEGYKKFSEAWKDWFKEKGVSSSKNRGQRNSVDHILFGSTPDPVDFLTNFENERLNKNT